MHQNEARNLFDAIQSIEIMDNVADLPAVSSIRSAAE
jgi:hypothetical protein